MASDPEKKNPVPEEVAEAQQKSAFAFQDPTADWIVINPPHRVKANLKTNRFLGERSTEYNNYWTQFGTATQFKMPLNIPISEEVGEHEEHERTREFVAEKLEYLAKKQDIIETKGEIIKALNSQIADLTMRLEAMTVALAKTEELETTANRVCDEVKRQSEETRRKMTEQLADLRHYLSKFAPHRRFFKVTFGFLCFFSITMLINSMFGIRIVEPFWGAIGVGVTAAMLIVIFFGMRDYQQ